MARPPTPPELTSLVVSPDTTRYVAWRERRGQSSTYAREETSLRIGTWAFFDRNPSPGVFADRAALDAAGHVIHNTETADWHAFLAAAELDAAAAHERIAWLLHAAAADPHTPGMTEPKVTMPTLTSLRDGTVIYQGWIWSPKTQLAMRITITASADGGGKITAEPAARVP